MPTFRGELAALLKSRGVNASQYSRLIGHDSNGLAYNVIGGKKSLPLEELDDWLGALGVKEGTPEYRRLRRLAYEDYAPPHILRLIDQMTFEVGAWMRLTAQALRAHGIEAPPLPDLWQDAPPGTPAPTPTTPKRRRTQRSHAAR